MTPTFWVALAVGVFVAIQLVQLGVRKGIERAGRRLDGEPTPDPASWRSMIVERHRAEGARFDFAIIYWGWPVLLGSGFGIAASIGAGESVGQSSVSCSPHLPSRR
jgi:hypothetical protein